MLPGFPEYRPPRWLRGPHVQTLWPSLFRRVTGLAWERERLELADGDFLDLDWSRTGGRRLAVVAHGLEGDSRRAYVSGLARALNRRGWDVVAWNLRGCSGEPNRLARSYHSGASEDLAAVVMRTRPMGYAATAVTGFSLGGNLTLKFLGEGNPAASEVSAGAAISVPCDLRGAALRLAEPDCALYLRRFLRTMIVRMEAKHRRFGNSFPAVDRGRIHDFRDFDDAFTAPLHGFLSAEDYWARCSALRFLSGIQAPVLILNAADDPFLSPGCYPYESAQQNPRLTLEVPQHGGHVGFVGGGRFPGEYWSEWRVAEFLNAAAPIN